MVLLKTPFCSPMILSSSLCPDTPGRQGLGILIVNIYTHAENWKVFLMSFIAVLIILNALIILRG